MEILVPENMSKNAYNRPDHTDVEEKKKSSSSTEHRKRKRLDDDDRNDEDKSNYGSSTSHGIHNPDAQRDNNLLHVKTLETTKTDGILIQKKEPRDSLTQDGENDSLKVDKRGNDDAAGGSGNVSSNDDHDDNDNDSHHKHKRKKSHHKKKHKKKHKSSSVKPTHG